MAIIQQHIERIKEANAITNRKTVYAAGAGLIPFPVVDAATLLAIQLTMIQSIGQLYNIEFKQHLAKSLIGSLIGSISSVSLVKLIPGLGTVIGGATASVAGAAATYALGRVFTQHFDQGGTLLDFDPVSSREYFQKEFESGGQFIAKQDLITQEVPNGRATPATALAIAATATATVSSATHEKALLEKETTQLYAALQQLQISISTLQAVHKTDAQQSTVTSANAGSTSSLEQTDGGTLNKVADFTVIKGIDAEIDAALKNAKIYTMRQLAHIRFTQLKQLLKDATGNFNFVDPTSWPLQATLAASGKMVELKQLQKELIISRTKRK